MTSYKMSVICDTLEELGEVTELLLSRMTRAKGAENVATDKNPDDSPADSGNGDETGQGTQEEPKQKAPKRRVGRPKGKETAPSLPGVLTLDEIKAQARKFAQTHGAPALIETLGSFGAKSTNDLKLEEYQKFSDALINFATPIVDSSEPETTEDPYNDLL